MTEERTFPPAPKKSPRLPYPLPYERSPNQSPRRYGTPFLIVLHRPVGDYKPSIDWLRNPRSQASAHVITEGRNTGVDVATQLVSWDMKAWACESFNSYSYNIEVDDDAWDGKDWGAFYTAARITAFLCTRTGIRPHWTRDPLHVDGFCRHLDLGQAGGGHSDPTTDPQLWQYFISCTQLEHERGHFRETWGRGELRRLR